MFASGILAGLILFLAMAFTGVVAVNGTNNPGISPVQSAAAGSTGEASPVDTKPGSLASLDLNRDGHLSLAEAAGHADIVTRFNRADRNRDGKLSFAEYDSIGKPRPARKKAAKGKEVAKSKPAESSASAGGTTKKPE